MRNKLRTFLFLVIAIYAIDSFAQKDSSSNIANDALEMRNSLDNYLLKNIGNNPLTLKEKYLVRQIDSLKKLSNLQSEIIANLNQGFSMKSNGLDKANKEIVDTLFFEYNSSKLNPIQLSKLKQLVQTIPSKSIQIVGSTDAFGSARFNHLLGMERALFVKKQIENLGYQGQVVVLANAYNVEAKGKLAAKYRMATIRFINY